MNESLTKEKKKEVLKQQSELKHAGHISAGSQTAGSANDTESRKREARKNELLTMMNMFSSEYEDEWDEEKLAAQPGLGMSAIYYSISDFEKLTTEKSRSGSAVELRNCILEMKEISKDRTKEPPAEEYVEKLFELYMASNSYCDSHQGRKWSIEGAGRSAIAEKVRKMTSDCLGRLITSEEEEKIRSNEDADFVMGESMKSITKDLARAAEAYKTFASRIGNDCQAYTPQEILNRRMQALRTNERKIKLYRMHYPEVSQRDPAIQEMIRAYEEGLRWEAVRSFTKQDEKGAYLSEMIEKHVEEEGEIEHREKLTFTDQNEGLEADQVRCIEEIDNWLIRNFQNGGLAGKVVSAVKNANEDFVSTLLSLTKRERLHIYYLVETGKRKDPSIVDVGASQSPVYKPNLDAFKSQMLATKWKFWTRLTGGYTYMEKLTQAFQKTALYRKQIQSLADLKSEEKRLSESLSKKKAPAAGTETSAPSAQQQTGNAEARMLKLIELKGALEEYHRNLQDANKAKGKKKQAEEVKCREAAEFCQRLMRELVDLDNAAENDDNDDAGGGDAAETVEAAVSNAATIAGVPSKIVNGVSSGTEFFGGSWHLDNAGWGKVNLWTGSISSAADMATTLVGAVTTMLALKDDWGQLTAEERSENILNISQSVLSIVDGAFTINGLVETGGIISEEVTVSAVTETAGTVTGIAGSVISGGIAIAKSVSAGKMKYHGSHAKDYFKEKQRKLEIEDELYGNVSKEKKRELKYEKNMVKLQGDLLKREVKNAACAWVDAGLSVASLFIPGIGIVSAGFALISSIIDSKVVSGIRTRLFDNFFNMDNLVNRAMESKEAQRLLRLPDARTADREKFKESLRKRVAACAGFCDMKTAATDICTRFARLIRGKLFGGKAENDEEKNGYVEFVRSLSLKYNSEKEYPEENILVRKLSAQ